MLTTKNNELFIIIEIDWCRNEQTTIKGIHQVINNSLNSELGIINKISCTLNFGQSLGDFIIAAPDSDVRFTVSRHLYITDVPIAIWFFVVPSLFEQVAVFISENKRCKFFSEMFWFLRISDASDAKFIDVIRF